MTNVKLSPAQERYLKEIRERPGIKYNGRARKPLDALVAAGLITYQFDLVPHVGMWTEMFTCWPVIEATKTYVRTVSVFVDGVTSPEEADAAVHALSVSSRNVQIVLPDEDSEYQWEEC